MRSVLAGLAVFIAGVSGYRPGVNKTRICGDYDTVPSGDYTLLNNLWGLASIIPPPTGYGCSNIDARDNSSIAWTANFSWTDWQFYTKGFTCVQQNLGVGQRLQNIASMPTVWKYDLNTTRYSDLTFNMAYDLFTANTSVLNAPSTNEIMIWPTTHYMVPVTTFDLLGKVIIHTPNLTLGGYTWDFYTGVRNNIPVWSLVNTAAKGDIQPTPISFKFDLMVFVNFLISNGYVKGSDYLNVLQAGTEVIKAGATIVKTSFYNTDINWRPPTSSSISSKKLTSTSSKKSTSTSSKKSASTSKKSTSTSTSKKATTTVKTSSKATSTAKTTVKPTSTKTSSTSPLPTPKTWKLVAPCVLDPWPNTLLTNVSRMFLFLNPPLCMQTCDVGNYTYAGVEFGSACYCGNTLNTRNGTAGNLTDVSQCANPCSGDLTLKCGGYGTMTLYQKS